MPETLDPFIVRIRSVGDVLGQEAINVWYFHSSTYTSTPGDILSAFDASYITHQLDIMNANSHVTFIDAQFERGSTDFASLSLGVGGHVSGDCLPAFVSWDFTLLRGGALERNGYKRIQGVSESDQLNGQATAGAFANLNALSAFYAAGLTVGTDAWLPAIRRTKINHVVQTPPKYFTVSNVIYSKIGSQNTRKPGHGR